MGIGCAGPLYIASFLEGWTSDLGGVMELADSVCSSLNMYALKENLYGYSWY